jgi:hypothetical protein
MSFGSGLCGTVARGERHADQRRTADQEVEATNRPIAQSADPGNPVIMKKEITTTRKSQGWASNR